MSRLITIDFHGDTLFAAERENGIFVAIKPIADRLGLDWSSQHKRISRDPILVEGMVIMTMPSAGGEQETTVLRLDLLNGWLFGIDVSRMRAEFRDRVLAYKRECYAVLFGHFYGRRGEANATLAHPACAEPFSVRRSIVTEARQIFGDRAANSLWFALGLPAVPEMKEPNAQGDLGFAHTARPLPSK